VPAARWRPRAAAGYIRAVSRAIQIQVSESVVRAVHVEDGVEAPLEMLPILPPARQRELLAAELAQHGFSRDGAIARRRDPDGVEIAIDLDAATVAVRVAEDAAIEEAVQVTTRVDLDQHPAPEAHARGVARRELEARVDERAAALQRALTDRLARRLGELRRELDGAVGRATVAALTEKAAALGQIESVVTDAAGNVAIKVRL
jgi:hypothetical protein